MPRGAAGIQVWGGLTSESAALAGVGLHATPEVGPIDITSGNLQVHQTKSTEQALLLGVPGNRPSSVSSSGWHLRPPREPSIGDTSVMASGLGVGGDVEKALESVGVPSYVLDETGVVRWLNPAAERLVGDVRGRHFTSVVAPEDRPGARERFAQKMLGTSVATEVTGELVSTAGTRVPVEVSTVPLMNGERVVGVFGLIEERPDDTPTAPLPHLTPRQVEVLRLLEQGRSTKQIAAELHLSPETVRNHVRRLFRALGVNSRLEAVAVARRGRGLTIRWCALALQFAALTRLSCRGVAPRIATQAPLRRDALRRRAPCRSFHACSDPARR